MYKEDGGLENSFISHQELLDLTSIKQENIFFKCVKSGTEANSSSFWFVSETDRRCHKQLIKTQTTHTHSCVSLFVNYENVP